MLAHERVGGLLDLGFSPKMIATLLDVTVAEVWRWRSSAVSSSAHEDLVAELLGFCDMMQDRFGIEDPAAWFEKRLTEVCVIDMQEVYGNRHVDLVLDFASGRKSAEGVLDAYEPSWRDIPPSMWEVVRDSAGEVHIVMKDEV
jgi:hypothetical protein